MRGAAAGDDVAEGVEQQRRIEWRLALAGAAAPLIALYLLYSLDVPLGKPGKFAYLYSPIVLERVRALPWAMGVALVLGLGGWLALGKGRVRGWAGGAVLAIGMLAGGWWCFFAPPAFVSQHYFNMVSPSQDGAFMLEAGQVRDVSAYLRQFPERARTPEEVMRGTRVISNPPGATLLAFAVRKQLDRSGWLAARLEAWFVAPDVDDARQRREIAAGLAFSLALSALWLAAGPFLYLAARELLPRGPALLVAVGCLFTPATLGLSPGKDPAQLLTVALPLWLWLRALRRQQSLLAALAGFVGALTLLVSLVHVWIAGVLIVASACDSAYSGRLRQFALRVGAPAAVAGLLLLLALYLVTGIDTLEMARAVAAAQATVTRGPAAMPWHWQLLGAPLFLLFAGPALWAAGLWACGRGATDDVSRFGGILAGLTAMVLIGTVVFTNVETPRLWIPFTPLLLVGLLAQARWTRLDDRASASLVALMLALQFAASAASWSVMDMREAENRLVEEAPGRARLFH